MKVLMIAPQPFFEPRGTPFSVLYRLHALSELGHEVDLLTYHLGQDIHIKNVKIYRTPNIPFIKNIAVGPSKRKVLLDLFIFLKAFCLIRKGNYDLIHSHEEASFFSTWFSKRYNLKHLYDMHSSLPQQLENFRFTKSKFIINCFKKLENKTIKEAQAIITICPSLYEYVEKLYPGKNQVLIENVVENKMIFKDIEENETKAEAFLNIKNHCNLTSSLKILYAGTFEPYQGIDMLIESAKRVIESYKNVLFLLVGGNLKQVDEYKRLVCERGLNDHFIFSGQVRPGLVPKFIDLADILVSTRIQGNNTPLKIYTYLRSGKPIVATNHPTHTQVLNDKVAVLTECTPESFAKGVCKLIESQELRKELSENAKKLADEKYSYEIYISRMKKIYESL